jgi:hypothetical protein
MSSWILIVALGFTGNPQDLWIGHSSAPYMFSTATQCAQQAIMMNKLNKPGAARVEYRCIEVRNDHR